MLLWLIVFKCLCRFLFKVYLSSSLFKKATVSRNNNVWQLSRDTFTFWAQIIVVGFGWTQGPNWVNYPLQACDQMHLHLEARRTRVCQSLMGFYLIYFLFISLCLWFKLQPHPAELITPDTITKYRFHNSRPLLCSIWFLIPRSHHNWCMIWQWNLSFWINVVPLSHLFSQPVEPVELKMAVHLKLAIMNTNERARRYGSLRSLLDFVWFSFRGQLYGARVFGNIKHTILGVIRWDKNC